MRTVQLMSIRKLMLPPVVSRGQYQIMESRIAMVEHIAITDRAMTGPQWHNRRTSWRFSNVTKVERKFIFPLTRLITIFWLCELLKYIDKDSMYYYLPLLSCKVSGADDAHIFSLLLTIQQLARSWVTGALCVPLFLALAKSSILSGHSCEHTILVSDSNSPSKREDRKQQIITTSNDTFL